MASYQIIVPPITAEVRCFIYNFKARTVQNMLDFDYVCKRSISIAGLINPGTEEDTNTKHKAFFGNQEVMLPVYGSIREACRNHPEVTMMVNFASFRSAYNSTVKALDEEQIRTVVIIAEGIPERQTRDIIRRAHEKSKLVIGPSTVGFIHPGAFKCGDTAGMIENVIASKLFRPGSVGFVSKSGGMSNECYNIISQNTDGVFEGVAIGGDEFPGSTLLDHLLRYEAMPEVKMLAILGELGGSSEYDIVEAMRDGRIKKPLVAWVSGSVASIFKTEVQFGHAGARTGSDRESALAKNKALREAGATVPDSFIGYAQCLRDVYNKLAVEGVVRALDAVLGEEPDLPSLPVPYAQLLKDGLVRRSTGIVSTICDDRGSEPTYAGVPVTEIVRNKKGLGYVIGLLWFKRQLPDWACGFIERVLILAADHGPCVSGAHNAIITARAGKDLVSAVCSGMLTIGPRFGGAIDDAARYFAQAVGENLGPYEFVDMMKKKGIRIPGIGHRIKSRENPDQRVELLKEYAREHFPSTDHLTYAISVEDVTLKKANNLILNVDGCIGVLFLDLMKGCAAFRDREIRDILSYGALNGLFVLARTIGFIGHVIDQKRLNQGLYRHAWDDVLFCTPSYHPVGPL